MSIPRARCAIAGAACLYLACSTVPLAPVADVGVELPARYVETATIVPQPSDERLRETWWSAFGDARLDELVIEALERNPSLQVATARVRAARAQARIAGADLQPRLNAELASTRARRNFIGFPIPGAGEQVLSTTSSSQSLSLAISWEADLWGRLQAGEAVALADLGASQADLAAAQLSLTGQAARAWLGLIEGQKQVELAQQTLESRQLTSERVRERYRSGLVPSLDLRLSLSEVALAESGLLQRLRAVDLATRRLEALLGRYPEGELPAAADLPVLPPPIPTGLPAELVSRRPDLWAAELRLAAAGARVAEARRALYPRLTLTGSSGTTSSELGDLLDGNFSVWNLAAGLLQPLFQGGSLRAVVDLADSRREQALASYVSEMLAAFTEVESALARERLLEDEVAALSLATEQAGAADRLAKERYAAGLVSFLAVLESERQAFLSRSQLLAARRQRLDARVDLILSLGGGFSAEPGAIYAEAGAGEQPE